MPQVNFMMTEEFNLYFEHLITTGNFCLVVL